MRGRVRNPQIAGRLRRLRRAFRARRIQGLLVTDPTDVGYLSGFTGDDSWLLAGRGREWLVTDFRFAEQAARECPGVSLVVRHGPMVDALAGAVRRAGIRRAGIRRAGIRRIGFDPEAVTVANLARLRRGLARAGAHLVPVAGAVSDLRMCKDRGEVRAIRRAARVSEKAFAAFRKVIRVGMTERALAAELDHRMRLAGAEGPAFPTVVAADASSSMPHARPGRRRVRRGSLVLVDFGARVDGYACDLTRALFVGKISPHVREVYEVVLRAQAAAIARVKPGAAFSEVDAAARQIIADAGLAAAFGHGTGHGIGRSVHEEPRINPVAQGRLEAGMVVTVEPGVYLEGRFGIRIEDTVLVTRTGHQVLTRLPKDLRAMVLVRPGEP